jgi:hypothetical protein
MAKLITIYWRDIPVQVMAKRGRTTAKVSLSQRFLAAVDRAAMRAHKTDADAYLTEWRRVSQRSDSDDLDAAAAAEAARIEQAYSDAELDGLARRGGILMSS